MTKAAPDPRAVREASLDELSRLGLPLPPLSFPLVWELGDTVELRPLAELEARAAVLHVVVARCFGMPTEAAMSWLLTSHLVELVTPPEWQFVIGAKGDHRSFVLHHDAVFALAWLLGLGRHLDPAVPPDDHLMAQMPDLPSGETFGRWRSRSLVAARDAAEAAVLLDLYYCLDWAFQEAEQSGRPLPGEVDSNAIGQRRWALEWAVIFHGPYHDKPPEWEEVDLSV
ncbi:DUF4272 domain-containing protein [Actinoplanes awajinensis]|uniref:DUF4272 domain-containing protein n=1 Tax=Actinoplanes awajinensis subsp. mycoplanecinus TaxID=135947 RepID=A0A0X3V4C9_9ACTN|nr:DUF4272 domain-containing protein [Actinoplanes awajinensis]KUL39649.1 hypothetical protein ADL15_08975 [Actinoplanes awajinensis subsp. mycoplanecinus]